MREEKRTLYELLVGIVLCLVICLIGTLIAPNRFAYTLGLLLGGAIAGGMSLHMYRALQNAMLYDEKTAAKKVQAGSVLRVLFILTGLVAAMLLPQWFSVIGVALGVLSLKFSAYLQPLTHKFLEKFINKGR